MKNRVFLVILGLFLLFPYDVSAEETIVSSKDAQRIKDANIAGISLGMSLEDIAYAIKDLRYESSCGMDGCHFSKRGTMEKLGINFQRNIAKSGRVKVVQYQATNIIEVCENIFDRICLTGIENVPCSTKNQFTVLQVKSVEPDEDGWQYSLNAMLDSQKRKCEVKATQGKVR